MPEVAEQHSTMQQQQQHPPPPQRKFKPSQHNVPKDYYGDINSLKAAVGSDAAILADLEKWTMSSLESSRDGNISGEKSVGADKFPETYDELIEIEVPDTNIGEGVDITGELVFKRLLRVDGIFRGSLTSSGNIVVGKGGSITGNLLQVDTVVVNGGRIEGNLIVESLVVKNGGVVIGDISCKTMKVLGTNCQIKGRINVHSLSPEVIDENGDILFRGDYIDSGAADDIEPGDEYYIDPDSAEGMFDANDEAKFVGDVNNSFTEEEESQYILDPKKERERLIAEKRAKKIALSKQVEDSFRSKHTNSV